MNVNVGEPAPIEEIRNLRATPADPLKTYPIVPNTYYKNLVLETSVKITAPTVAYTCSQYFRVSKKQEPTEPDFRRCDALPITDPHQN